MTNTGDKDLLFEIGVEELPASFLRAALSALEVSAPEMFRRLRLTHGEVRPLGTPRRVTLSVRGVSTRQADVDEQVVGPPESAGFRGGVPTKAAEAFAAKLGVSVDQIGVEELSASGRQKAGRYVVGRRVESGANASALLGPALAELAAQIPFRKSMRWGSGSATFGRPVRWLVALFGDDVLDVEFAGVRSGRSTRGHRFLSSGEFDVDSPSAYVDLLRARHVLVDPQERRASMLSQVDECARRFGAVADADEALRDENASLVEEPRVVVGSFEASFLELPKDVIVAVARGHQKYLCLERDGALLPNYICVAGTAERPEKVIAGNDRVMRARLSDARFFFDEDRKGELEARVEKLAGIVFQHKLGSVLDKTRRLESLATTLASAFRLPEPEVSASARAAHLCKQDLTSLMVGEFPELQGVMGRVYALLSGESGIVANATRDHYHPLGASGAVPTDHVSAVVALADRLDTLVGCFAVGFEPSGTADPYALRRNCIAVLRILYESPLSVGSRDWPTDGITGVRLTELLRHAFVGYEGVKLGVDWPELSKRLSEFAGDRLKGLLATMTSTGVADAVMAGNAYIGGESFTLVEYPEFAVVKARELQRAVDAREGWLDKAKTVSKRLSGISREAAPVRHSKAAFGKPTDGAIVRLVESIDELTFALVSTDRVREALRSAERLANEADEIFTTTLVNDPADDSTPRRLELLSYGAGCMRRIAEFSRLGSDA